MNRRQDGDRGPSAPDPDNAPRGAEPRRESGTTRSGGTNSGAPDISGPGAFAREHAMALEVIAAVYRQLQSTRSRGKTATGVVLPASYYQAVQSYRAALGEAPEGMPDYLGKHELFGLPIYTDTVQNPQVLVRKEKNPSDPTET